MIVFRFVTLVHPSVFTSMLFTKSTILGFAKLIAIALAIPSVLSLGRYSFLRALTILLTRDATAMPIAANAGEYDLPARDSGSGTEPSNF